MRELDLERQLRQALRDEADAVPFTVTGDVARARLASRRGRGGRSSGPTRLWLVAAAIGLLGVATLGFAVAGGWFAPTPEATPVPPSESPAPTPLGAIGDPDPLDLVLLDERQDGVASGSIDRPTRLVGTFVPAATLQLEVACVNPANVGLVLTPTAGPAEAQEWVVVELEGASPPEIHVEPCHAEWTTVEVVPAQDVTEIAVRVTSPGWLSWRVVVSTASGPASLDRFRYACSGDSSGHVFAATVFDEPAGAERVDDLAAAALQTAIVQGDAPGADWRLAARDDELATFLGGEPGGLVQATIRNTGAGTWRLEDVMDCQPVLVDGRAEAASLALDPSSEPDPTATSVTVLATERACASGREPGSRLHDPIVIEGPDRIVVAILVDPAEGDQDCPSNPAVPVVVRFGEALGGRTLVDGGELPLSVLAPVAEPSPDTASFPELPKPDARVTVLIADLVGEAGGASSTGHAEVPAGTDSLYAHVEIMSTRSARFARVAA